MNPNSRTTWARAVFIFLMTVMVGLGLMLHASAQVGQDVGKGGKDAGKGVAKGGKDAGKGVGKAGKDVGKGIKKAVSPPGDSGDNPKN